MGPRKRNTMGSRKRNRMGPRKRNRMMLHWNDCRNCKDNVLHDETFLTVYHLVLLLSEEFQAFCLRQQMMHLILVKQWMRQNHF